MKIIEEAKVRELLTPKECIEVMKQAFVDLEEGKCDMPPRLICRMPNTAAFGFMPAYAGDYFGAKVITAYAPNMGTEYPSHIGYCMLFESEHCTVVGMVEAGSITEIRTGCVSALATDLLANKDAHKVAMIGAGAQARSHLAALLEVRSIDYVTVYDINPSAAEKYAFDMAIAYGLPVEICDSVKEAVKDADIICTVCPSKEAYLTKDMVKQGAHINAVGTFTPTTREVDSDLMAASKLYADYIPSLIKESGEYLIPLEEGLIGEDHIQGSVGQLLTGKCKGRESKEEITLFDALGLAIEDVAAAVAVLKKSGSKDPAEEISDGQDAIR